MSKRRCDACGARVEVPGGVGDFWDFGSLEKAGPGGLTLELDDGSEFFLCYDCIEALPEDPARADVEALTEE
ncbi:hypothetical protein J2752_001206 [Halarchaeum rubridurum]|uniref:Small CPxCG-related zinc finger protein n=1 Tax=Halarchaeum rubridurum TaxID=489911 RepID=A0A830FTW4_9EURY|nr:hypothetical protein [Halarchaeum rubridurum]MBP1954325.1 hypothetical protein [Halarchaeum rubridurum]GGM59087.1 hypothetical protein GCM10009017_06590 [Halarchaeum rubridurum]